MFKRILIANRGEIALRIIRACREMGIETVAVYSDADRMALHVRRADFAYRIGPAPPLESYLVVDRILEVAERSGAEAIHPGYGFLAENAGFAEAVQQKGMTFIGPRPSVISLLGNKLAARTTMQDAGVPVVPGTATNVSDLKAARKVVEEFKLPVLIKAAAGGGGKGMRVVHDASELESSLRTAASEAKTAFGDDTVYIEKYLERPRHIEVQVIADHHGNAVHLGERECSLQRRHQKVVEESPSPVVDPKLRARMGETALIAVRASGYTNAGTVEFLMDQSGDFYFLEVNTRLQVEHPVTEMVTGIDLVKEQIQVAFGEPLSFSQSDIQPRGSAIECRIYAEDPANNFFPSIGIIGSYQEPSGPGVRVDSGFMAGDEVSINYDPLLAKLIVWGKDRDEAIRRMKRALGEYHVSGVVTNIDFHLQVMDDPDFVRGDFSTHYIDQKLSQPSPPDVPEDVLMAAVMAAGWNEYYRRYGRMVPASGSTNGKTNRWKLVSRSESIDRWR